ncbi:hypothetical protein C8F01DRAFT_1372766 [Mycena amicta]|nr:hypothetical protein C8F01DRAFT_1372766 [Mycena amicta]
MSLSLLLRLLSSHHHDQSSCRPLSTSATVLIYGLDSPSSRLPLTSTTAAFLSIWHQSSQTSYITFVDCLLFGTRANRAASSILFLLQVLIGARTAVTQDGICSKVGPVSIGESVRRFGLPGLNVEHVCVSSIRRVDRTLRPGGSQWNGNPLEPHFPASLWARASALIACVWTDCKLSSNRHRNMALILDDFQYVGGRSLVYLQCFGPMSFDDRSHPQCTHLQVISNRT